MAGSSLEGGTVTDCGISQLGLHLHYLAAPAGRPGAPLDCMLEPRRKGPPLTPPYESFAVVRGVRRLGSGEKPHLHVYSLTLELAATLTYEAVDANAFSVQFRLGIGYASPAVGCQILFKR